jgi:hypothetical protein
VHQIQETIRVIVRALSIPGSQTRSGAAFRAFPRLHWRAKEKTPRCKQHGVLSGKPAARF